MEGESEFEQCVERPSSHNGIQRYPDKRSICRCKESTGQEIDEDLATV